MKKIFEKYKEIIVYVFFGGLTTVVNYIIHFGLRAFDVNNYIALSCAWFGAVIFAYATNKLFVFNSKAKGKEAAKEFSLFIGARVFSYGLELLIFFIFITCAHVDKFTVAVSFVKNPLPAGELIVKTFAQVVIIISNYVFSKFIIFKKSE